MHVIAQQIPTNPSLSLSLSLSVFCAKYFWQYQSRQSSRNEVESVVDKIFHGKKQHVGRNVYCYLIFNPFRLEATIRVSLPPSSLCNRHGSKYPGCVVIVHRSKRGRGGNNPGRKNRKHRPQARVYKYTPRYTVPREQSGHRASEQRPASNRSDIEISRIGLISSG